MMATAWNEEVGVLKPFLIGIAGGSGSGKTTVARRIAEAFDPSEVVFMDMDSYYKDLAHLTLPERRKINFDHPGRGARGFV